MKKIITDKTIQALNPIKRHNEYYIKLNGSGTKELSVLIDRELKITFASLIEWGKDECAGVKAVIMIKKVKFISELELLIKALKEGL